MEIASRLSETVGGIAALHALLAAMEVGNRACLFCTTAAGTFSVWCLVVDGMLIW
ncbi:Hypothetical protein NGAL_HAMBI490_47160 [Neorhizobium galegae bv. officinalis]|nr:Hypothetical protein NGAL_HAMBI490_47160 [Neorhizobium galegae bv. officinalis]